MKDPVVSSTRRWPLWTAAVVAAGITVVHALATPRYLGPLLAVDLEPPIKHAFEVLWHMGTLVLATLPVALAWSARSDQAVARPVLAYSWVIAAGFAGMFLVVNIVAFGTAVFTMPQWILFLPLIVLIPTAR